jgi:probable HAF family extracellular repeat protein
MKMTGNSRMQSLLPLIALSLGLSFVSPVSAQVVVLLDSSGKVLSEIGDLGGGFPSNPAPAGINDAGQVVGWSDTAAGQVHAFITGSNGKGTTDLGTLGGNWDFSEAYGINNAGQVVGGHTQLQVFVPSLPVPMGWA